MVRHHRVAVLFVHMLLVVGVIGGGPTWANEPGAESISSDSLLTAPGDVLTEDEMQEIDGEGWRSVASAIFVELIDEAWDYSDATEWLQETAFPAIESAAVTAYDWTKDALATTGDMALDNPHAWAAW